MNDAGKDNLYSVLGVRSTATQAEIQAAFRQKARELHPDVNRAEDAEERFKKLLDAYEVLRDETRRSRYDAFGSKGRRREPSFRAPRDVRYEDIRVDVDDLRSPFDEVLRREQKRRARGKREIKLNISLEQAYRGATMSIVLEPPRTSSSATGKSFRVRIPAGAMNGDRLEIKDHNLVAVLKIQPHEDFELNGRDVTSTLAVAPWEAALGATVDVRTPVGFVKVRVPEGTSSGQRLRLKGKGIPQKEGRNSEPGDFYARVRIVVPPTMSNKERSLWEKLRNASKFEPRG